MILCVLGHENEAFLYVTCLDKGHEVPVVKSVGRFDVQVKAGRVYFLATFASLLKIAVEMLWTCQVLETWQNVKQKFSGTHTNYFGNDGTTSKRSGNDEPGNSDNKDNKQQKTQSSTTDVKQVASCGGRIKGIEMVKDSATSSPYYFKGSYCDWDKNETKGIL
jgi:hypothetical protein